MDRLVKAEEKEVELIFKKGQRCGTSFKLTNLMHTMSVAVFLTTTNPSLFSLNRSFSVIHPLSSSSYILLLSQPSDQPPFSTPTDVVTVRTAMLPTGKAHQSDLRHPSNCIGYLLDLAVGKETVIETRPPVCDYPGFKSRLKLSPEALIFSRRGYLIFLWFLKQTTSFDPDHDFLDGGCWFVFPVTKDSRSSPFLRWDFTPP